MRFVRACLGLLMLAAGSVAQAETISIGALKDNTIYESVTAVGACVADRSITSDPSHS